MTLVGDAQPPLPWAEPEFWAAPPANWEAAPDPALAPRAGPCLEQLSLGANQIAVWDIEPEPLQTSLFPEASPWELAEPHHRALAEVNPRTSPPGPVSQVAGMPGQLRMELAVWGKQISGESRPPGPRGRSIVGSGNALALPGRRLQDLPAAL